MVLKRNADQRSDRPPKSWPRRILITFNIVLAVVLVAGVAGIGYAKWQFGQIAKIDLGAVLRGEEAAGNDMNVLMVGSDSREELAPGQTKQFGSAGMVGGQRSDTIMVLHVEPKNKRASILSIPRDTYVNIYDENGKSTGKSRINSAYEGGPKALINTITKNFEIPIDHYAEVNFDSFRDVVNAIGGVPVRFDSPARDSMTGLNITAAGCVTLNGDQALAYVRSRHYQTYEGGRWHEDPRADLSRIDRQQDFIRRVLRQGIEKGGRNPLTMNALISAGVKNVKLDAGFGLGDITKTARRFQSLEPTDVEMMTLPAVNANVGGASVLQVKQPDAKETIDRFLGKVQDPEQPANIPPSSISVRVLNGSGVSGQATQTAGDLKEAGFVISGTGDAKSFGNATTTIRYAKGMKDKASVVASYVSGAKQMVEDTTLRGVDVVLVTSSSFGGIVAPGQQPPSTTTTTSVSKPEPSAAPNEEC